MIAPFFKFGFFGDEIGLIIAFLIGIGFGFALEKGGFGGARKLAAQFYFYDMTVFKVMFTAIVTAMLGVFFLSTFGVLDYSLIYAVDSYILPQAVGGLILGFGFVIGGYCPGTGLVAVAVGKIDGIIFIIGVILGIFIFGLVFPYIEGFYNSTNMEKINLSEFFNIPYGIMVFAVVLMAVGGFCCCRNCRKETCKEIC